MTNAKHTPAPWRITDQSCRDYEGAEIGTGNKTVAVILTADAVEVTDEEYANARRICAAVNACEGISTEALEQNAVQALLEAAEMAWRRSANHEKLTFQECNQLCATIVAATGSMTASNDIRAQRAQAVLDPGTEIDVHELLAARKQIAAIWSIEDVQQVRPDLTDEQAWKVLRDVYRHHDAEQGINWTTLESMADILFAATPETTAEEE